MGRLLPIFILIIGVIVLAGSFIFVTKGKKSEDGEEEKSLIDVPLGKRPFVSLIPKDDGHWLKLTIDKIEIENATTLDYELLYEVPDGRPPQGVPGKDVDIQGKTKIERDLLLGSESSGRYRYDEGVKKGKLTLKFRNKDKKLLVKFSTDFNLLSKTTELSFSDKLSYKLPGDSKEGFFVTMETVGYLGNPPGKVASGPYGVFRSGEEKSEGEVSLTGNVYRWNGNDWEKLEGSKSSDVGVFIAI